MNRCYALRVGSTDSQTPADTSFIGGFPKLPSGIPIPLCKLCGIQQTFFLQIAFPQEHTWRELTLSVFACTSCADEDSIIPPMLEGRLPAIRIPRGFLVEYQKNFSFQTFGESEGIIRKDYAPRVKFKRIELEPVEPDFAGSKIGGNATWLLEDETPSSYGPDVPMCFLIQLGSNFQFGILDSAPRQVELALDGTSQISSRDYYQLFNGNAIFLFGTTDKSEPLVYAITQT